MNVKSILSFLSLFVMCIASGAWAGNFPWDQSHDTIAQNNPTDPASNGSNNDCNSTGSPVFLKSGQLFWKETDISLGGRPEMKLVRTFHSQDHKDGMFGPGWTGSCQPTLVRTLDYRNESGGNVEFLVVVWALRMPDGKRFEFTQEENRPIVVPAGLLSTITSVSNGGLRLTERDGSYHEFNSQGQLIRKADRNGNLLNYSYTNGQLSRMADTNGRSFSFVYNASGRVSSVADHTGRSWQYAYSSDGTLQSVTNPMGGVRSYQYQNYQATGDGQIYSQLVQVTDESNVTALRVAYTQGKVASYSEGANTFTYSRNAANTQITKRDSQNSTWIFSINERGLFTNLRDPLTYNQSYSYNDQDQVTSYTDQEGLVISATYDSSYRVVAMDRGGSVTRYSYSNQGIWPTTITSPTGLQTTIQYDAHGNPTQISAPQTGVTRYSWSANGDLLTVTDALNSTWRATYNSAGKITQLTNPQSQSETFQYDSRGNLTSHTNGEGEATRYQYDLLNRVVSQQDAMGATTLYSFDAAGRMLSVETDNGAQVTYSYDQFGRLVTYTHFDGRSETYTYRSDNFLSSVRTPLGNTKSYTFDANKNATRMTTSGVTNSYTYNRRNQILSASNSSGVVSFAYDLIGRLTSETSNGELISYTYDSENHLLSKSGLGETVQFSYDDRGLISQVNSSAGNMSITSNSIGKIQQIAMPNGINVNFAFDASARLSQINHGAIPNAQYAYQYDSANRITRWSGDGLEKQFQYDQVGRLTQATGAQLESFNYDSVGNRLNDGALFDTANRILEDTNYIYQYDANGNRTLKQSKTTGARQVFTYNALNQLTRCQRYPAATGTAAERTTTYEYDAIGRRTAKVDSVNGRVEFIWAGSEIAGERESSLISKVYSRYFVKDGSDYYFIHRDHLGTPQMLTNSFGQSVWSSDSLAFGSTSVDGSVEFNLRFPGQYFDSETGLHYNYFRDYDPSLGRYLQSDPVGLRAGINTYLYVRGNPISFIDPFGLTDWGGVGGAAVDGGVTGGLSGLIGGAFTGAIGGTMTLPGVGTVSGAAGMGAAMCVGGAVMGAIEGALDEYQDQNNDDDGDGVPNVDDPINWGGQPDHDGDGVPNRADDEYGQVQR